MQGLFVNIDFCHQRRSSFSARGRCGAWLWTTLRSAVVGLLLLPPILQAETFAYQQDQALVEATVRFENAEISLREFLAACEGQTRYKFAYKTGEVPLDARLQLPVGRPLSLAELFWQASEQAGVVFQRMNGQIVMRPLTPEDVVRRPEQNAAAAQDVPAEPALETFRLDSFAVENEYDEDVGALELRMQDVKFQNLMSSEDISRYAASDMSEAIARVAGVNVIEGRFAVIRGLSERYSATLVNGVPVPSADPEKQGVHLDLFSSDIVSRLEVSKTFSPEAPSNAAGGFINIITTEIPDQPFGSISFGTRFNDRAQRDYVTYTNPGRSDSWAMGTKDRAMDVFRPNVAGFLELDREIIWDSEGYEIVLPEGIDLVAQHESPPPGLSFLASGGGGFDLLGRRARAMVTIGYDSSYKTTDGSYQTRNYVPGFRRDSEGDSYFETWYGTMTPHGPRYDVTQSKASVDLTALGAVQLDLDAKANHRLTLNLFHSQAGEDSVAKYENGRFEYENEERSHDEHGWDGLFRTLVLDDIERGIYNDYYWDLLYYEERKLTSLQLLGDHAIPGWGSRPLEISWTLSRSKTQTDEPDARSAEYIFDPSVNKFRVFQNVDQNSNNYRSWRFTDEEQDFARIQVDGEWELSPAFSATVLAGVSSDESERAVLTGRSLFRAGNTADDPEDLYLPSAGASYRPSSSNYDADADASRDLKAGFGQIVFTWKEKVDLILGFRAEKIQMASDTRYPEDRIRTVEGLFVDDSGSGLAQLFDFGPGEDGTYVAGSIDRTFLLPSVGAAFRPWQGWAIRLQYNETVARPSFREYTGYFAFVPDELEITLGNAQLETSDVRSTDFRIEYVDQVTGDLVATSFFYKEVDRPIERVQLSAGAYDNVHTWINNPNTAYLRGVEIEFRKQLNFLRVDFLNDFSLGGNYTYIDAVVGVPQSILDIATSNRGNWYRNAPSNIRPPSDAPFQGPRTERRLYDQPEWIANVDVTYDNKSTGTRVTIAYNAISNVLSVEGPVTGGVHGEYDDSFYELDFAIRQRLRETLHLSFSVKNLTDSERKLTYDPYMTIRDYHKRTYRVGRDYSISLTYEF